ncbi:MAG TPA: hypothetical protein VH561_03130 [Micromonosporaceae bacterium]|jgi:uncharacterized membrane-anchored protein
MNLGQLVIIAALVVLVIVRRFSGSPVTARSGVLPAILVVVGAVQLHTSMTFAAVVLLAAEAVLGAAAGVARGYTIHLYERDGHLWQRYTVFTLLVWFAMIGVRVGAAFLGQAMGIGFPGGPAAMITFGLSLLVEAFVVRTRATQSGVPLAQRATLVR